MSQNQIGNLGELLAETEFCRPVGKKYNRPLFRANNLGQKYPVVDFVVDLLDSNERSIGFFYVQVKSTHNPSVGDRRRLPIECPYHKYNAMVNLPVPTYLVGVDVSKDTLYILAANRTLNRKLSSIGKLHDLSADDIKVSLYKEVLSYWKEQTLDAWKPRLTDDRKP